MKTFTLVASLMMLLGFGLLQPGCASTGSPLPPEAKTGLSEINASLMAAADRVDAVVETLRKIESLSGDAVQVSSEYAQRFAALERALEDTRSRMSTIRGPETFFESWKADLATISDTHLRESGQERYDSARRSIESLNRQIDSLRDSFTPMFKNMQDIATVLKNDPTTPGLEKAGVTARRTVSQHGDVQGKINAVQRTIDRLMK